MRHRVARRLAFSIVSSTLLLCGVAATGAAAVRTTPAKSSTPLQQGLNFYKGKTLTWVDPGSAGSSFDVTARVIAPYVAKYLGASAVNIFDDPGGNSVQGSDYTAAQSPTGLVFGLLEVQNVVGDLVTGAPGVNFNPEREAFVGTIPNVACSDINLKPGTAFTTFASLLKATSSNPVVELAEPTGDSNINQRLFNLAFGINARMITGYSNSNQLLQGFLRGDGELLSNNVSAMVPSIQGGAAIPVALNKSCPAKSSFAQSVTKIPTFAQLYQKYPAKTNSEKAARKFLGSANGLVSEALFTQTKVPADEVDALRYAIQKAEQNPNCKTQLNNADNPYGWTSAQTAKSDYFTFAAALPKIYHFLGLPVVGSPGT